MANPCQTEPSHFHQNLANGLEKFMFVDGMDEGVVAPVESLQDPVEPGQLLLSGSYPFWGLLPVAIFWLHVSARGERPDITGQPPKAKMMACAFSFLKMDFR
jgi:hypothetical protein